MVNPYIDMWDDNNITLGWDIGDGRLLTQGGDYRYVENPEQRSVVFLDPTKLLQGREPSIDNRKVETPENLQATDPLANINIPQKPPVPSWFNASQPEQNLRQAEEELNQAKVEDAQYGSEGYENKENGVFNRIKNWGSSVGDYLFGRDKTTADTQVPLTSDAIKNASLNAAAQQAIDNLNDRAEEQAKEEQGILGYYGNKILGEQGRKELQDFKSDWKDRGIGAVTQRANSLLETMARSPYSYFVDPTTVLGGQRTMVNDIDSYFDKRGLQALRNDLVKQDLLNNQTLLGQARQYANASPEERAAIDQYMRMRYLSRSQSTGAKDPLSAVRQRVVDAINSGIPTQQALQEGSNESGIPVENLLYGKPSAQRGTPATAKNPIQSAQLDVVDRVNKGTPMPEALQQVSDETGIPVNNLMFGSKQPAQTADEVFEKGASRERAKVFAGKDGTLDTIYKNAEAATEGISEAREALKVIQQYPSFVGGGQVGEAVERFVNQMSFRSDDEKRAAAARLEVALTKVYGDQIAKIIDKQNVGSISDSERRLFNEQTVRLGDSPAELQTKLRLYILENQLAIMTRDFMNSIQSDPYKVQEQKLNQYYQERLAWTQQQIAEAMNGGRR